MTKFKSNGKKISVKLILVIAAAVILIILSAMCTVQVPTGHTGVVVYFRPYGKLCLIRGTSLCASLAKCN